MAYRTKASHLSLDPEKRENQLRNLVQNRMRRARKGEVIPEPLNNPNYPNDVIKFLEEQFFIPETKSPIVLENFQKEKILEPLFYGDRSYTMALIGEPKKSGKSCLAAGIANWYLFTQGIRPGENVEVLLCASDKEQSSWIVFSKIKEAIRMNRKQLMQCDITADRIEIPHKSTVCRVLATDVSGAGQNADLVIFDELYLYRYEGMKDFFEVMTTTPTKPHPLILIITTAGYNQDSEDLLYSLYKKGMELKKDPDPSFFFWWDEGEKANRMPWQNKKYLDQQKGRLRKNTYLRLHENRWVEDITQFIDIDKFDQCVNEESTPVLPDKNIKIWVGVDASISGDSTAVVAVTRRKDKIILANYKKWQPTKENPIDLEETVEKYLIDLSRDFNLQVAYYDPYQLHRSAVTLKKKGLFMKELPQTVGNTIDFSQTLYDLIQFGNIEFYPSPEVRRHVKSCKAKEMDRGYRIVKESHSEKIDIAVALAMASLGAVKSFNQEREEKPQIIHSEGGYVWVENPDEPEEFGYLRRVPIDNP
jgi:phage terminase large subunit-like protein